jgi:hypothetical protein
MSNRVIYLHLGSPKTGTSFLQAMLSANRERLLEDGVLYPDTGQSGHHRPARDLRNVRRHRVRSSGGNKGAWNQLLRQVHGWDGPGPVVVSSELLAFANRRQSERALTSLGPAEVHLVLTVRDVVRQVPAVWQETVKNRSPLPFDEFVRELVDTEVPWHRGSWGVQEPATILDRWGREIPPDRVHLVTVPPPGADPQVLWQRFAQVIGVDPDRYPPAGSPANTSLGVAETEVVRRLNEVLQSAPWPFYAQHIKHGIARGVLAGQSDGARLVMPDWMLPWAERRSREIIDSVANAGYDVVGDFADLMPPADGTGVGKVPDPDPERLAWASAVAADYLAQSFVSTWKESRRRPKRPAAPHPRGKAAAVAPSSPPRAGDTLLRAYRAGLRRRGR